MDDLLLEHLRMLRASILHWQDDKACGLLPTDGTLAAALVHAEAAIAIHAQMKKGA